MLAAVALSHIRHAPMTDSRESLAAAGTPEWVTQRLALGSATSQALLQPAGLATLGNYVFCTFYVFGSSGAAPTACCQSAMQAS